MIVKDRSVCAKLCLSVVCAFLVSCAGTIRQPVVDRGSPPAKVSQNPGDKADLSQMDEARTPQVD